ncbi:hypothetical protein [Noviherbaspirillum aerium]|uniref:hypothetical protein n=1 Tax=Noviherbaspirillum aerium TaxID=2588497 RepID=UPI00124CC6D2|nr:hypothetical protein [Noviherbaspirillum aerium]
MVRPLNSLMTSVRQLLPSRQQNAAPAPGNAAVQRPLATHSNDVNRASDSFLEAARACRNSNPPYAYNALKKLYDAGRQVERAFTAQGVDEVDRENLQAHLTNANARLPVQPSKNRAVLAPLLQAVQQELERSLNPAVTGTPSLAQFPPLYAAIKAYLEAIGAQTLHPGRRPASLLPASAPRLRTHEDIHEQTLRGLLPDYSTEARRQALTSQAGTGSGPVSNDPEVHILPGYAEVMGHIELSADLNMRVERNLRKLRKPLGTQSLSDPSSSALLKELKFLVGSTSITAAERGEILYRLAAEIPQEHQVGGIDPKMLARLFLRVLAPNRLPPKYTQSPAALDVGVATGLFNPDDLVPSDIAVKIVSSLIRQARHFRHGESMVPIILKGALENRRGGDPLMHIALLLDSAKAIRNSEQENQIRNKMILRDLVAAITDEIKWLAVAVAQRRIANPAAGIMRERINGLEGIAYDLTPFELPGISGPMVQLNTVPGYIQLRQALDLAVNSHVWPVVPPPAADEIAFRRALWSDHAPPG